MEFHEKLKMDEFFAQYRFDGIFKPRSCGGDDGILLLMKKSREQPEPVVLGLKKSGVFVDSTLAQNKDLIPPTESIDDHGPFFKRDTHAGKVKQNLSVVESESLPSERGTR